MLRIGACSRPGSAEKLNEDRFWYHGDKYSATVVVADGVTQPKSGTGTYPSHGARAAELCVETVCSASMSTGLSKQLCSANRAIRQFNRTNGTWNVDQFYADRSCCTAALVTCYTERGMLMVDVASVGDPFVVAVGTNFVQVLNSDQLRVWREMHPLLYPISDSDDPREVRCRRLAWQRKHVRNNPSVKVRGKKVGFGTLDGDPRAEKFIESRAYILPLGTTVIVGSDALRILSNQDAKRDDPKQLVNLLRQYDIEHLPHAIVDLIREKEGTTGTKPDDATVVVVSSL